MPTCLYPSRQLPLRLRHTSALTDCPLSCRISAAISVITPLNRGQSQRSLLRATQKSPPDPIAAVACNNILCLSIV